MRQRSRLRRWLALACGAFLLVVAIASCQGANPVTSGGADLVLASKGFTEQDILQELLAQQIEHQTHLRVDRRRLVGFVSHKALMSGEIDGYVEYTGTAYVGIFEQPKTSDRRQVYQRLQQLYGEKGVAVLPALGFENTFAMLVRGEVARRHNLRTLSDAVPHTPNWQAGFGYEFLEREDGYPGLAQTYGLQFARPPRVMDLGLIYRALLQKQVDLIAGNSTDGQIARLDVVMLADDRDYFPPYEAVPLMRQATLEQYPAVRDAIAQLAGKLTADEMQQLNYQVEGELRDIKVVVREFLQAKGLL